MQEKNNGRLLEQCKKTTIWTKYDKIILVRLKNDIDQQRIW